MEKIIISCLESRVETNQSIYARFLLGPFKNDQAVTIATALRRSLLSQVKNVAITAIHIQGVTHEFSTIVGVRESVLDLALNFQQVVLRTQSNKHTNVFNENKIIKAPVAFKNKLDALHKRTLHVNVAKAPLLHNRLRRVKKPALTKTRFLFRQNEVRAQSRAQANKNKVFVMPVQAFTKTKFLFGPGSFVHPPAGFFARPGKAGPLVTSSSLNQLESDSKLLTPSKETAKIGYLQVQGPKVIYANDLKLPVGVECVDPTQYIATLSTEGLLVVKFVIGYKKMPLENNKEKLIANLSPDIQNGYQNIAPSQLLSKTGGSALKKNSRLFNVSQSNLPNYSSNKAVSNYANTTNVRIFDSTISLRNTIFLDPIFDSVFKVNYLIEKDDLFNQPRERILLEFWTNGSIHPRQALHKASLSLISTFSIFRNVFHLDSL